MRQIASISGQRKAAVNQLMIVIAMHQPKINSLKMSDYSHCFRIGILIT